MKLGVLLLWTVAAVSASAWAQEPGYPITVVPPGKGPYQFPPGVPNALGQDRDAGYGEAGAESLFSARFGGS